MWMEAGSSCAGDPGDEEAQIRRAQRGDLCAFESLVQAYEGRIRGWAIAHAPPGADADDVAQNAFIQAFRRLGEYRAGTNFGAWLFTIARYQLMTEATRLRRIADYHSRFAPEWLDRELERQSREVPAAWAERVEHLRACVRELGDGARQVLAWRYDERIPVEEMARRIGKSVPSIKKQLFVLRKQLGACVERKLAAEGGA